MVSIKRFDTSGGTAPRISMTPGRYDIAGLPLSLVVGAGIGELQWTASSACRTGSTQSATRLPPRLRTDPPPAAIALNVMLANLLKDRFKLATHRETRQLPVYDLVFARTDKRLGPGLKPASPECQAAMTARLEAGNAEAPCRRL